MKNDKKIVFCAIWSLFSYPITNRSVVYKGTVLSMIRPQVSQAYSGKGRSLIGSLLKIATVKILGKMRREKERD